MQRTLGSVVWLLAALTTAAASDNRWPAAAPASAFMAAPGCEKPHRRTASYDACADQMALFTKARADAAATGKTLLVVFGATWCPSCKSLSSVLPGTLATNALAADAMTIGAKVHVVEITVSTLAGGRIVDVPSGSAVRAELLVAKPAFKPRAIPYFAAIDPATGRTSVRNLDDLEFTGTWNLTALGRVVDALVIEAGGGPAASLEPGWLRRKWRRWTGH